MIKNTGENYNNLWKTTRRLYSQVFALLDSNQDGLRSQVSC